MSERKPNIVFILEDHQAFYGHGDQALRSNFKKFAAEGVEFTQNFSVSPMCGPARRSFLTGLYPHTHGQIHNENDPWYVHDVYLDNLHEAGYVNYYYGKWHAGPGCAYDHFCDGFNQQGYGNPYNTPEYRRYCEQRGLPRATHRITRAFVHNGMTTYKGFSKMVPGALYQSTEYFSGEHAIGITVTPEDTHMDFFVANLACDRLEELAKNKDERPFCLNVHFWGPHQPFFPTQKYLDMYNEDEIKIHPSNKDDLHDKPEVLKLEATLPMGDHGRVRVGALSDKEWREILHYAYAQQTMLDYAGGKVIDKIRELGLDDNTVIIWTTDHGDALCCHGGHFDKDSHLAMEVLRTPLAMNWKGHVASGQIYDGYTFTCDVPCTFMDAAREKFSNTVDGKSLLKLLNGEEPKRDAIMVETYGHGYGVTRLGRGIISESWKYDCYENDIDDLYNLKEDPWEMRNLAQLSEYADKRIEMRTLLRREQTAHNDPISLERIKAD